MCTLRKVLKVTAIKIKNKTGISVTRLPLFLCFLLHEQSKEELSLNPSDDFLYFLHTIDTLQAIDDDLYILAVMNPEFY